MELIGAHPYLYDRNISENFVEGYFGDSAPIFDQFVLVGTTTDYKHELLGLKSFGSYQSVGDGEDLPTTSIEEGHLITGTQVESGLEITLSPLLNRYVPALQATAAQGLGRAYRAGHERKGAGLLIDGFTTAWADGQNFFSATHPTDAGNQSNLATTELDSAALAADYVTFMQRMDDASNPMCAAPALLVVPPALMDTAIKLTTSPYIAGDPGLQANPQYGLRVVVNPFLTDTDDWFTLLAPASNGLRLLIGTPSNIRSGEDPRGREWWINDRISEVALRAYWQGSQGHSVT